jgi:hypothetical protein
MCSSDKRASETAMLLARLVCVFRVDEEKVVKDMATDTNSIDSIMNDNNGSIASAPRDRVF